MKVDFTNTGKIEFEKRLKSDQKSKSKIDSTTSSNKIEDKLDISEESKKLVHILNKLKSGYYDQKEVILETAKRINFEI
jgi:hypothetical protein